MCFIDTWASPELLRLKVFQRLVFTRAALRSHLQHAHVQTLSRSLRSAFSPSLTHQCYCGYRGFIAALATGGERRQHLSHPSKKKKKHLPLPLFFPDYFLLSWSLYLSCLLPPLIAFLYFLLLFTSLHLPSCLLPKIEPSRSLPLVPPHSSFSSAPLSLLHSSTPWLSPPRRIAATQQSSLISRDAASQQNGEVIVPDSWWFYLFLPSSPPVSIHPDSLRLGISSSTPFLWLLLLLSSSGLFLSLFASFKIQKRIINLRSRYPNTHRYKL